MNNAEWLDMATLQMTVQGHDPNIVMRELCAYISGHPYDTVTVQLAIQMQGPPPHLQPANYEKARARYIQTGDLGAFQQMLDAVKLDG